MALTRQNQASQETSQQATASLELFRMIVKQLREEVSTTFSPERKKNIKNNIIYLNHIANALKNLHRPAAELAECQFLLANLHLNHPIICQQAYSKEGALIAAITHCANTIRFAREIKNNDNLKNDFIINGFSNLTAFLGDPQIWAALGILADKKEFLRKLSGNFTKGLEALVVTDNLSVEGKEQIGLKIQPLLGLLHLLSSGHQQQNQQEQNQQGFFRKPLEILGRTAGFGIGLYTGGIFHTAILTYLWGKTGDKTGEVLDHYTESCRKPSKP